MVRKLILAFLLSCAPAFGALDVFTGQCAADTADATTTCSHSLASTPTAILMWANGQTSNGSDTAGNASWSFGCSDATNFYTHGWAADDNVATTNDGHAMYVDGRALVIFSNGTPTVLRYVTDFNPGASTFDLVWDGTPAAAYLVNYMIFGGADITNDLCTTVSLNNATGDQAETGIGFEPNFGIFFHAHPLNSGSGVQANTGIGFAATGNPANKQFTACIGIDDGQTMTAAIDAVSYTDNDNFICSITAGAETIDVLMSLGTAGNPAGWNSDGFNYNVSNAPAAAMTVGALFFKGGQWDVGTTTTPISSGTTTVSSMTFQPQGLFLAHGSATANATVTIDANSTVGAAVSTSTEASGSASQDDAVLNTTVNRTSSNSQILASGAFPLTAVEFTSFQSNGWTGTEGGVSATAYQLGWFAMGNNAAAPSCAAGQNIALLGVGCR